jgi:hypothetical protein
MTKKSKTPHCPAVPRRGPEAGSPPYHSSFYPLATFQDPVSIILRGVGSSIYLRGEGRGQNIFEKRGGQAPLLFFWRGGSPLSKMGDPPLSRGSTGKIISGVIPCEVKVAFMQKRGGRVTHLPKRGGSPQNIFK